MSWRTEQEQFWGWISRPQDLSDDAEQIAALLAPHSHLSQAEALSIYNNAYHQRLVEVSSALFPVLFNTLGRDLYTQLWIGYMGKYPPRNGPIHRVGESLCDYLREHEQFRALPAVADIVRLETLLIELFDLADEAPYTLQQLQSLPAEDWPQMRWPAKNDWALLHSRFDLEKYWRQMHEFMESGGVPGGTSFGIELTTPVGAGLARDTATHNEANRGQGPLPQGFANLLVYRKQHRMQFQAIGPELALFLTAIQTGENFAQICSRLALVFPAQDIPSLGLKLLLRAIELELLTVPAAK
ncbi:MAG: putative DNA-binding domain-containing protein [Gammaproteobacteria bacterium]|nr:putative DNA-binding domain-containing protein [Gammaproteobacteria bacterium]